MFILLFNIVIFIYKNLINYEKYNINYFYIIFFILSMQYYTKIVELLLVNLRLILLLLMIGIIFLNI